MCYTAFSSAHTTYTTNIFRRTKLVRSHLHVKLPSQKMIETHSFDGSRKCNFFNQWRSRSFLTDFKFDLWVFLWFWSCIDLFSLLSFLCYSRKGNCTTNGNKIYTLYTMHKMHLEYHWSRISTLDLEVVYVQIFYSGTNLIYQLIFAVELSIPASISSKESN